MLVILICLIRFLLVQGDFFDAMSEFYISLVQRDDHHQVYAESRYSNFVHFMRSIHECPHHAILFHREKKESLLRLLTLEQHPISFVSSLPVLLPSVRAFHRSRFLDEFQLSADELDQLVTAGARTP